MPVNITSIATTSIGVLLGDDPLHCAFSLLIIQILLILTVSRTLAFFFRPLRQPRVIPEILGGILLGPLALGRIPQFKHTIFPTWSTPILGSVANMGLVFFLFLVRIELDMPAIRRSGRGAAAIGATGIACTFGLGDVLAAVLYRTVDGDTKVSYAVYTVFMGVAICITAFPVLARMLAKLKLLTTRIGETAMAPAALNDVAAWVFLAIVVSLARKYFFSLEPFKSGAHIWTLVLESDEGIEPTLKPREKETVKDEDCIEGLALHVSLNSLKRRDDERSRLGQLMLGPFLDQSNTLLGRTLSKPSTKI